MVTLVPQRRGDFNHQTVVSAIEVNFREMLPTWTYGPLIQDGLYLYGSFRTAEGKLHTLLRKVASELSYGLVLNVSDGTALQTSPRQPDAFRGGSVRFSADDDHFRMHVGMARSPGEPFLLEVTKDRAQYKVVWDEGDILHLEGFIVGNAGVQMYDPMRDGGNLYCSYMIRASGHILGEAVEGFFGFDQQHLRPGTIWRTAPYFNELEIAWHTMTTEYDDGTIEVGQICHGGKDWGFAVMLNQDGPFKLTTDVTSKITFGDDEFPRKVEYLIDGEEWDWVASPDGTMPYYAKDPTYRPCDGTTTRKGETRKVVCAAGFLDAFNDGRS
ncbi:hypothetical protein GCM10009547_18590 [Sporichthya brevicatena]|uniref:Uncharacterized protein n=1 Tax=Sporichthya brevicatena TaxID=171442 RepID=A0ABN1GRE6_9ACTN